ncbi:MAG: lytic transglycosylase domain-containing protein [Methylobacillus sp.]|jgi:soluble lytic murein transglycosylase-like protein|nr:lytic transglycosylase domain-containing protein [Methylobacillus sp.]
MRVWLSLLLLVCALPAFAGNQKEEPLSNSVQAMLHKSISDSGVPKLMFADKKEGEKWLAEMSSRLEKRIPNETYRLDFLRTVHYEATRAGLDPQLVLGLIQVESGFKKYAVSSAGARGYMQVMPFWVRAIGAPDQNLFHLRVNLRYGCTILRYYLDGENGNLYRALGRYNGSVGQAAYPNAVLAAWKRWAYPAGSVGENPAGKAGEKKS